MNSYRLPDLFRDATSLAGRAPSAWAIWKRHRLDPILREEVMVAVAASIGCRFCTFSHRELILESGGNVEALAEFEGREPGNTRAFAAIVWAQAWVEGDFGTVPPAMEAEFEATFSPRERTDIETVALSMKVMSSCGHQADGLLSRLRGSANPGSSALNEALMATLYFPPAALVYLALGARRRDLRGLLGDFSEFSTRFTMKSGAGTPEAGREGA